MAAAPIDVRTYAQLYDSMLDPPGDDYTNLLERFGSENGAQPAAVRDALFNSGDDFPKVFAVMQVVNQQPTVMFIHRPFKFVPSLASQSPWDDHWFAFAGDVNGRANPSVVNFPANPFTRSADARVPTVAQMPTELAALADGTHHLGPYIGADPNTEGARCRAITPIPKRWVSNLLDRRFSVPEFWQEVIENLVIAEGRQAQCPDLIRWARIAMTKITVAGADVFALEQLPGGLTSPILDATLRDYVNGQIVRDLPSLNSAAGIAHIALQQGQAIQNAVTAFTNDAAAARTAASQPSTISRKFPQTFDQLLRMCEVPREADAPDVWRQLSAGSKKEAIHIIRNALQNRARDRGVTAPIATPELVTCFNQLTFGPTRPDDLTQGMSLFTIVTDGTPQADDAQQRAAVYSMMQGESASPGVQEVHQILSRSLVVPLTLLQLGVLFNSYSVLVDVVLGNNHRVAVAFRNMVLRLHERLLDLENNIENVTEWIPRIIRCIHLAWSHYWMHAQRLGPATPLPPFDNLISIIDNRNFPILPPMPLAYLRTLGTGGFRAGQPSRSEAGRPPAPTGPTNPGGPPPGGVVNLQPVAQLVDRFRSWGQEHNVLSRNRHPNPRDDSGDTELCLLYHLKCSCNERCSRKVNHRPLSEGEETRLSEFLTTSGVP